MKGLPNHTMQRMGASRSGSPGSGALGGWPPPLMAVVRQELRYAPGCYVFDNGNSAWARWSAPASGSAYGYGHHSSDITGFKATGTGASYLWRRPDAVFASPRCVLR